MRLSCARHPDAGPHDLEFAIADPIDGVSVLETVCLDSRLQLRPGVVNRLRVEHLSELVDLIDAAVLGVGSERIGALPRGVGHG